MGKLKKKFCQYSFATYKTQNDKKGRNDGCRASHAERVISNLHLMLLQLDLWRLVKEQSRFGRR